MYLRSNNMKACESWLQLSALQTLLLLLVCFQCTSAREESCPQMNEVQNSLEKNYQCNATCGLMQLVKLQELINFTSCYLEGYIKQSQDAMASAVHLLLNAHSEVDNLLTTDLKKIRSLQGSVNDTQRLLSLNSCVVSRIQFDTKLIANSSWEIAELQQSIIALEHNLSQYNSEAERLVLTMNATLITLDRFLPDFADTMKAVETLILLASSAENWARAADREADSTYGAALLLAIHHDDIEPSLTKITEICIIIDTENISYTQRNVSTMANDFGRLLVVLDEVHGSLAELINDSHRSLNNSFVHINDRMYFEVFTALFVKIRSALAEYEAYEQEILLHAARAAVVQQHAIMLNMQELSIARLAAAAGILDLPDENSRLLAIQTIVEVALQVSATAVNTLNTTFSNQTEQEMKASILKLKDGEQLQSQIRSINASLTSLLLQLECQNVKLKMVDATNDGVMKDLAALNNQIQQTASKYWQTQKLVERLWREASSTLQHLADIRVDQVNRIAASIGSVQNDTERILQNTEEVAAESFNMTVRLQLVGLSSSVSEVKNTTATLNQSLQDLADLFQDVSDHFTSAERTTDIAYNFLDQVSFPLKFTNDTILTINPSMSEGMDPQSKELRSIALIMKADQTDDSILLHYAELAHSENQNISLTIGLLEGNVYASFVYRHPEAGVDSVNLTIPDKNVEPFKEYSIEVTRTERNVHLFLVDVASGEEYHVSGSASDRITFLKSAFHQNALVNIGGIPNEDGDGESIATGNFSGCIGSITINGLHVGLWQMASHMNAQPCTECLESFINPPLLYFGGWRYAQTNASGNMFPLQLSFNTLLPNGLLMSARDEESSSSLQIGLRFGHIIIRVVNGNRRRTLTSSGIYHTGSRQDITVMLTPSMRGLLLRTIQEETVRGLNTISAEELTNYSQVLIGGVPPETELNINVGNFTGCIGISTAAMFEPPLPSCIMTTEQKECSYCSNQAVLSASFYGASYAEFPPFSIENDFDISFSFRTSFPNGLIIHGGDVSEQAWITLVLIDSQLHLIFGSSIGNIDLPAQSPPLNNNQWHSAAIVKTGSSLYLFVNGTDAGRFPFGSFLPTGTLASNLFIGGVDSGSFGILFPGVSREGFKGCLNKVYVMGRPLDFNENEKSQQIAYNTCTSTTGGDEDVYFFNGSSSAEYDLGRFEPDFSVGFQLRTLVQTGLILYLFSRTLDDVFAIQLVDGELQLYTANSTSGWVASSSTNVTNGLWHSVVAEKVGDTSRLVVDGVVGADAFAPSILRTKSPLYIGGLPSNRRVWLPSVITSQRFVGCLITSFLSYSQLNNVLVNICTIGGPNNN